ncbi:MAG: VOC family protein [Vicinamibacterales bacterium]|nr:VOC family protein [Vicinamibacterales bacterium]
MSRSHPTLPTRDVQATASFLEKTLGYARVTQPANSLVEAVWLNIQNGQQIQVVFAEGFTVSRFDGEVGHIAVFHPAAEFAELKRRLERLGAKVFEPERPSRFARFFFREPVNGYVFEVFASHFDH